MNFNAYRLFYLRFFSSSFRQNNMQTGVFIWIAAAQSAGRTYISYRLWTWIRFWCGLRMQNKSLPSENGAFSYASCIQHMIFF